MGKIIHGEHGSRTHNIWCAMKQRCYYPHGYGYRWYGAKGVTVCDEWKDSYLAFVRDMGHAPMGMTLDRIDNAKGYGPDNCRWASRIEQLVNSSANQPRAITFDGRTDTIAGWARHIGITQQAMGTRLRKWPLDRALSTGPTSRWGHPRRA